MFGWILDQTGSWTTAFTISLGLLLLGAVMTYWFRPDRPLDTLLMALAGLGIRGVSGR